jgi:hypothetical protein
MNNVGIDFDFLSVLDTSKQASANDTSYDMPEASEALNEEELEAYHRYILMSQS